MMIIIWFPQDLTTTPWWVGSFCPGDTSFGSFLCSPPEESKTPYSALSLLWYGTRWCGIIVYCFRWAHRILLMVECSLDNRSDVLLWIAIVGPYALNCWSPVNLGFKFSFALGSCSVLSSVLLLLQPAFSDAVDMSQITFSFRSGFSLNREIYIWTVHSENNKILIASMGNLTLGGIGKILNNFVILWWIS